MTGPRNRRALLRTGALALSAGLAGCVGGLGGETGDDTSNATTAETEDSAEPPLSVEDVRVQSSFFHMTSPDSADVSAPDGTQFVFADARPTDSNVLPPAADEVALTADDRRFEGTLEPGTAGNSRELYWQGSAYDPDEHPAGWVAFEVPDPLDAEEVALTYESGMRKFSESLDSEVAESLAEPPAELELLGFDHPESIERYERFELSVAVENVGEGDGVFRAVLNQTYPLYTPHVVEVAVPAGERREWARASNWSLHRDAERAQFTLLAPTGTRGATVEVESETTDEA